MDGCFWHGCPEHATWPKENADFWRNKIETNRSRDEDTDRRLKDAGWLPIRVWEHEDAQEAARTILLSMNMKRAKYIGIEEAMGHIEALKHLR